MAPGYTYPLPALEGDLTPEQIHMLLSNPQLIAKRVADLANEKFIADWLLAGRYSATGSGAILYDEGGDQIYPADSPEAIAAGAEFPLTVMEEGELTAARTVKWGLDSEIYDESIARRRMDPVNRMLKAIVNSVIRQVDSVALAVIMSKITRSYASAITWTSAENIVRSVLLAKAEADKPIANTAYNFDTVLVTPIDWATVMGYLLTSGFLPRENNNLILQGQLPVNVLGLTWVTSPNIPDAQARPMLVDRDALGGMADEDIQSPGYARAAAVSADDGRNLAIGIDTKVMRLVGEDDRDGYRARGRRITVPVITDPNAAMFIDGTK